MPGRPAPGAGSGRHAQRLDRTLACWRVGDPDGAYPVFDATGSALFPGRWNTAAAPVIYAAEHLSTALLEKLAHGSGRLPPNQHAVRITLPPGLSYEVFDPAALPGWDGPDDAPAQAHGAAWHRERRSAVLFVPSVVARTATWAERNLLLNPDHPEFRRVEHALHEPVAWDRRLFARAAGA